MSKILVLCLSFIALGLQQVYSQSSIGFDFEVNSDQVHYNDTAKALNSTRRVNFSPGLVYRYQSKRKFFVMSGFRMKQYPTQISFKRTNAISTGGGNMAIQVPLILGKNFVLLENKIFLSPLVGATGNYFLFGHPENGAGTLSLEGTHINYNYNVENTKQKFVTLNFGFSMEFRPLKHLGVVFFCQYNAGLHVVSKTNIYYRITFDPLKQATLESKGSYYTYLGCRVFYHFGRGTSQKAEFEKAIN